MSLTLAIVVAIGSCLRVLEGEEIGAYRVDLMGDGAGIAHHERHVARHCVAEALRHSEYIGCDAVRDAVWTAIEPDLQQEC